MKIGISVNVGLNDVTSTVYRANPLEGCQKDAEAMFAIAMDCGFDRNLSEPPLLGAAATHEEVTRRVTRAAEVLKPGDLFFFSFAGHGTFKFLNSTGEDGEEQDKRDESIVLSDHFMTDNFWRKELWPKFKPGVRVIAIADCCHAETVLFARQIERAMHPETASAGIAGNVVPGASVPFRAAGSLNRGRSKIPLVKPGLQPPRFRMITEQQGRKELEVFKAFYAKQAEAPAQGINASRLFLSACRDGQTAADGKNNGAFTAALLRVWNNGNFEGNYNDLMAKIQAEFLGTNQTPMIVQLGKPNVSLERPFTI